MGSHGDRLAVGPGVHCRPFGRRRGPGFAALPGCLRGDAISLRGIKLVHFWFIFPNCRIKVQNSCELGPFAGDVHDNGNVVYMVRIGPCCSNSIFYVS